MLSDRQIILNFHGIGSPHAGVEASERPYWIEEAFFRGIVDMTVERPDSERILWTFDDGNLSDLTIGARVLADRGRRGSFFLLTGRFGEPHYLSRENARELLAMGMDIGLHGRDHVDWRRIDRPRLQAETAEAREVLADAVGQAVDEVAVPFGAYNRRIIGHLKELGFRRIFTSDGGTCRAGSRISSRTSIRRDMSLGQVAAILDNSAPLVRKLKRKASTTLRRYLV